MILHDPPAAPSRQQLGLILVLPAVLGGCGFLGLSGEGELRGCREDFQAVAEVTDRQVADLGLQDAALFLQVDGRPACRLVYGEATRDTPMYLYSAVKWLSAGAILGAVDRGDLSLATRVREYYPATPEPLASATLAQLLSHTSGMPGWHPCLETHEVTLDQCVQDMLDLDLLFPPGTGFAYGGPAFSLAGAIAERATGLPWETLFTEILGEPLRLIGTEYLLPNPGLSEGLNRSSLDDYARFATMLLEGGVWKGERVLSHDAVMAMRTNWGAGTQLYFSPTGTTNYGLGAWTGSVDTDGYAHVLSSPGLGGFYPLIDFDRRMVVIFAVEDNIQRIGSGLSEILQVIRTTVDAAPRP